jgi:hypothetical protein
LSMNHTETLKKCTHGAYSIQTDEGVSVGQRSSLNYPMWQPGCQHSHLS